MICSFIGPHDLRVAARVRYAGVMAEPRIATRVRGRGAHAPGLMRIGMMPVRPGCRGRRQTAHFEQFEPERFDLGQHAVERGLVGRRASQHLVWSPSVRACRTGNAAHIVWHQAAADADQGESASSG